MIKHLAKTNSQTTKFFRSSLLCKCKESENILVSYWLKVLEEQCKFTVLWLGINRKVQGVIRTELPTRLYKAGDTCLCTMHQKKSIRKGVPDGIQHTKSLRMLIYNIPTSYPYTVIWAFGVFSFSVFNLAFHVHVLASRVDSKLLNSFTNPVYILTLDLMQCFLRCLSTK